MRVSGRCNFTDCPCQLVAMCELEPRRMTNDEIKEAIRSSRIRLLPFNDEPNRRDTYLVDQFTIEMAKYALGG